MPAKQIRALLSFFVPGTGPQRLRMLLLGFLLLSDIQIPKTSPFLTRL